MSEFDVPTEQQEQILTDRIAGLNLEGFNNEINLKIAVAANEESIIPVAEKNISDIRIAIDVLKAELSGVVADPTVEPASDPELAEEN